MPVHPVDSNTIGCWRFDESADNPATFADAAGNYPLTNLGVAPRYAPPRYGSARFGAAANCYNSNYSGDLHSAVTFECWIRPQDTVPANYPYALCYIGSPTGPDNTNNLIFGVQLNAQAGNKFPVQMMWQYANHAYALNRVWTGIPVDTLWHHLAWVRSGLTSLLYLDGTLVDTNTIAQGPTGGIYSTLSMFSGFVGAFDDSRLSKVVRSAGDIATDAQYGPYPIKWSRSGYKAKSGTRDPSVLRHTPTWWGGPYRKSYLLNSKPIAVILPPVVGNFVPDIGSGILAVTPISFTVSDPVGLRRVLIVADFPKLGLREVIHDGSIFGPAYQNDANQRIVTTVNGVSVYQYTVLRKTGWPESPTIIPYAIDTAGVENI